MTKRLIAILGSLLLSQQALAVAVLGDNFAGYANSLDGTGGALFIDTGAGTAESPDYSTDITGNITDTDAKSWVIGNSAGAYLDLSFNTGVLNGAGDDLKIFLVGGNGHAFDITIGLETQSYLLPSGAGVITGEFDDLYGTDPIVAMGINLDDFTTLSGPVSQFRLTIGDGWCDADGGPCSAVPSFVGAYSAVPVPAAVWLFGSGLLGLVGFARRRR